MLGKFTRGFLGACQLMDAVDWGAYSDSHLPGRFKRDKSCWVLPLGKTVQIYYSARG